MLFRSVFADAVPKIVEINDSKDVIGNIQYTYAGRKVGGADIEITGAKVSEFKFQKAEKKEKQEDKKEKVVKINVKYIFLGVLAVLLFIGVGFGIYKFVDNFYLIKYKLECKKQQKMSFKEIKFKRRKHRK